VTRTHKLDRTPTSLMPVAPVWTLVLRNQLTVPPAYDDAHAFFSIEGDRVVAYELSSGTRTWIVSARPQVEPTTGDGLVFLVEPGTLTARYAANGSIAWQLPLAEKLIVHLVFDNGWLVAATEGGEILAFRATDGRLIWRREIMSPAHALPALAADRVYVPTDDGRIVALRVETGEPLWERRLGGPADEILAQVDRLFVGSEDNYFYSLMTKDGRVDWRWRTGGDVIGLPVADEHRVYFVALDNVLRALDRVSGGQHWMRPLPLRPMTGPVRSGSTIVVTGQAVPLHAYEANDGAVSTAPGTIAPGAPAPAPPKSTAPPGDSVIKVPAIPIGPTSVVPVTKPQEPPDITSSSAEPWVDITTDAEIAAPPHALVDPRTGLPMLLLITRDIARGAAATLVMRSFEPVISPVNPLPNVITFGPPTTTK